MSDYFAGKAALVTGGASGIGRAVADQLAGEGVAVVLHDLNAEGARAAADAIVSAGGTAMAAAGDVSDPKAVRAAVQAAVDSFGGLHFAVNNAGIAGPSGPLADYDDSDGFTAYHKLMGVNLDAVFFGMRYEIPAIIAAGGGAIVNMSSAFGLVGGPNVASYTAAKHGVVGLTKAAGAAYAAQGVRINSVHPGYIDTPMIPKASPQLMQETLAAKHPMGRLGAAGEVANLVTFLLSDKAAFITASQHVIDGGYTAVLGSPGQIRLALGIAVTGWAPWRHRVDP
jgi:NAD(P)-dependent dehydrogenase (short-subunit alcohol dehydrogenase family)